MANYTSSHTGATIDSAVTKIAATNSSATELNLLDGVTATTAEINIIDGSTSATGTTLADADRVVVNDNGTMVQVALTDFETYFETSLDTLSNVTTVGALNSGSITSGFGSISNGSSAITTTGTITYGSLSDGSITITAFVDEDNMSSDSATLVPTQQSVKAYVDAEVSDNNFTTTLKNKLDAIEASATADQSNAEIRTAVEAATDSNVFTDTDHSKLNAIEASATADQTNAEIVAAVEAGSDSNTFTDADHSKLNAIEASATADQTDEEIQDVVGAMFSSNTESGITVTYQDGDGTIDLTVGTLNQDTTGNAATATALENARTIHGVSFDGTANIDLTEVVQDTVGAMFSSNTETNITATYQDGDGTIDLVATGDVSLVTSSHDYLSISGQAITLGQIDIGDDTNLAAGTNITLSGDTLNVDDAFLINSGNDTTSGTITAAGFTTTGTLAAGLADIDDVVINGTTIGHTDDTDLITLADGNVTIAGELDLTTLDVSGNADIDGTLEADAYTVAGTALNEYISDTVGAMVSSNTESGITVVYQDADNTLDFTVGTLNQNTTGNAATATLSSTVTITDKSDNVNYDMVFGNSTSALYDDTGALYYNPSTGTLRVPNLNVAGTTTTVDTVTMEAANAIKFEGATADANETILSIVDPTNDDNTQYLLNASGYIPLLAAVTTTTISSTPAELNVLDGYTGSVTELNYLDALHATGVTDTEFDYLDGVTSNIQTQLDATGGATSFQL